MALACLLALVAACGSAEPGGAPAVTVGDGPRVAHPRFDGAFVITGLVLDGSPVALEQRPALEIETVFGGLTVLSGCNTYFGAFTLDEDGTASFTLAGGSDLDCGPLAGQEDAVLAALEGAQTWTVVDGGFRFDGPGASITVSGPEGPPAAD